MPKKPITLSIPAHIVMFKYADLPDEWHVVCLETSAFGCGPTVGHALEALQKTLEGQYAEAVKNGNTGIVTADPDPDWVRTYREGKHPHEERVRIFFCGRLDYSMAIGAGSPKAAVSRNIQLKDRLKEGCLQAV